MYSELNSLLKVWCYSWYRTYGIYRFWSRLRKKRVNSFELLAWLWSSVYVCPSV